jgi:magnesium and cobalt transporter
MKLNNTTITDPHDDNQAAIRHSHQDSTLLRSMRNWVRTTLGLKHNGSLEESVVELIEEHAADGAVISEEERTMLHNLLSFGELRVSDIMIPRTDISAIDSSISLEELKKIIIEKEHTRMPVYRDSLDNVTGFIHIKDLFPVLCSTKPFVLEELIRQVLFVPPSMKVIDLLAKMRLARVHMALVLDEYGGTDGLVTIEDLVEEIIGDIQDEHDDTEEASITKIDDHRYDASARLKIEELQEILGLTLVEEAESEDFDTLGGLLFSLIGHVPVEGEVISHSAGVDFEITEADPRHIKRVLIRLKQPLPESES